MGGLSIGSASRVLLASLALCSACDTITYQLNPFRLADPLVGTWRRVDNEMGGDTITFRPDGSYDGQSAPPGPSVDKDFAATRHALASIPGHYSRSNTTLILTMDVKAVRKATAGLKRYGTDEMKGEKFDAVSSYTLSGDILEMTSEGKTWNYVRVK
jgi:hypothetical protein